MFNEQASGIDVAIFRCIRLATVYNNFKRGFLSSRQLSHCNKPHKFSCLLTTSILRNLQLASNARSRDLVRQSGKLETFQQTGTQATSWWRRQISGRYRITSSRFPKNGSRDNHSSTVAKS
nr:hypothetical protein CFP56_36336 [Quercus suber]